MADLRLRRRGASGRDAATPLAPRRRLRRLRGGVRRLLGIGLVLVLVVGGAWALFFSSWLDARTVEVTGVEQVSPVRVRHLADVPIGRPLARLDLDAVRARVESIAAVESAAVSRSWPHTVQIEVTERTPVAVVERGEEGVRQLDASGVLFGTAGRRPPGLPLVRADHAIDTRALAEAAAVAAALPGSLARDVDYLELRSRDQIVLLLRDGRRVVWGSADDSAAKAEVAAVLLRRDVTEVDVSVPARPTTRG